MKKERIYKFVYAFLISLYGFVTMFMIFLVHNMNKGLSQELYNKFNATYPLESMSFIWAFEDVWSFQDSLFIGLVSALAILFLFLLEINSLSLNNENGIIVNLLVIISYITIFWFASNYSNPVMFYVPSNLMLVVAFSFLCGGSSHLLLIHDRVKKRRYKQLELVNEEKESSEWRLKAYELEHKEGLAVLSSIIWLSIFLFGGMVITLYGQYLFTFPISIVLSPLFLEIFKNIGVMILLVIIGLFGIIYQILYEIHSIVDLITEVSVSKLEENRFSITEQARSAIQEEE